MLAPPREFVVQVGTRLSSLNLAYQASSIPAHSPAISEKLVPRIASGSVVSQLIMRGSKCFRPTWISELDELTKLKSQIRGLSAATVDGHKSAS